MESTSKELAGVPSTIETLRGGVDLRLARNSDLRVEVLEAGAVDTGPGLQVRRPPAASRAQVIVAVGAGTRLLSVRAPLGKVAIHVQ